MHIQAALFILSILLVLSHATVDLVMTVTHTDSDCGNQSTSAIGSSQNGVAGVTCYQVGGSSYAYTCTHLVFYLGSEVSSTAITCSANNSYTELKCRTVDLEALDKKLIEVKYFANGNCTAPSVSWFYVGDECTRLF
jgi:hypothetical protein